jgi:copper resistance protein B
MKMLPVLMGVACQLWVGSVLAAEDHETHRHDPAPLELRDQPTESERAHVPPPPPEHVMGEMSKERMVELMQMEDDAAFLMLRLDQLEWREARDAAVWDVSGWYGGDYDKLWIESEGEYIDDEASGRVEVVWDRIVSKWWSTQLGLRQDFGAGPSRTWAAFAVQGLAPYFFEIEAGLYVGEQGRTAARFSVEYDILLTQRLILQPQLELDAYGQRDLENGIGSGLSSGEIGIRLRYELRREIAPYIGVHWERKFGDTADVVRNEGQDDSETSFVIGLRAWF